MLPGRIRILSGFTQLHCWDFTNRSGHHARPQGKIWSECPSRGRDRSRWPTAPGGETRHAVDGVPAAFPDRKLEFGTCGRPDGTPCRHEHARLIEMILRRTGRLLDARP
jgi:hypothetical protein